MGMSNDGTMQAPYGSWRSPITAALAAAGARSPEQIAIDGEDTYWLERRPEEQGRVVLVRRYPDGHLADVTPPPYSVRSRVHEYGGGAYTVDQGTVYFVNAADQDVHRISPAGTISKITDSPDNRYADLVIDRRRQRLICVREQHFSRGAGNGEMVVNAIVAIDLASGAELVLVSGNDFYASPRLSPDGSQLAWLTWHHPQMPWDGTELWIASINPGGDISEAQQVAGGPAESIFQPEWSPQGELHFVSDISGWWNLHRFRAGRAECLLPMEAEFGLPQWQFGMSTYGFAAGGAGTAIYCLYTQNSLWYLGCLQLETGRFQQLPVPFTSMTGLRAYGRRVLFIGTSAAQAQSIVELDTASTEVTVIHQPAKAAVDPGCISMPTPISYPTTGGRTAYALFYAPRNQDYWPASSDELPPLIVISHSGPTTAANAEYDLRIQFWTSRGFAVAVVNYGGSTGFGRAYRERLRGQWGIVDVDDCTHVVDYLAAAGLADEKRTVIRGSSAGGYTALAALVFTDKFKAGVSYYGISDLTALAEQTHKFEARYLDSLIGPYPEAAAEYAARSPVNFAERITSPVIFFQGMKDPVVPPDQAERMAAALRAAGLPFALVTFENESHGFRNAASLEQALTAELYFYSRIFQFELPEPVAPVAIENL